MGHGGRLLVVSSRRGRMHCGLQIVLLWWLFATGHAAPPKKTVNPEVLTTFAKNVASALSPGLLTEIRASRMQERSVVNPAVDADKGNVKRGSRASERVEGDEAKKNASVSKVEAPADASGASVNQFGRYRFPEYEDYRTIGSPLTGPYGPVGYNLRGQPSDFPREQPPERGELPQEPPRNSEYRHFNYQFNRPFDPYAGFDRPAYGALPVTDEPKPEGGEPADGSPEQNQRPEDASRPPIRNYEHGPYNYYGPPHYYYGPSVYYAPYGPPAPGGSSEGNKAGENATRDGEQGQRNYGGYGVDPYLHYQPFYPNFGHPRYGGGANAPTDNAENSTDRFYGPAYGAKPLYGSFYLGGYPGVGYNVLPYDRFTNVFAYPHFVLSYPPPGSFQPYGVYLSNAFADRPPENREKIGEDGLENGNGPGGNNDAELISESKSGEVRVADKRVKKMYHPWPVKPHETEKKIVKRFVFGY